MSYALMPPTDYHKKIILNEPGFNINLLKYTTLFISH